MVRGSGRWLQVSVDASSLTVQDTLRNRQGFKGIFLSEISLEGLASAPRGVRCAHRQAQLAGLAPPGSAPAPLPAQRLPVRGVTIGIITLSPALARTASGCIHSLRANNLCQRPRRTVLHPSTMQLFPFLSFAGAPPLHGSTPRRPLVARGSLFNRQEVPCYD